MVPSLTAVVIVIAQMMRESSHPIYEGLLGKLIYGDHRTTDVYLDKEPHCTEHSFGTLTRAAST